MKDISNFPETIKVSPTDIIIAIEQILECWGKYADNNELPFPNIPAKFLYFDPLPKNL